MTDKELLEAAARAAGVEIVRSRLSDPINKDMLVVASSRNPFQATGPWNPLTDDGDNARLRRVMHILVQWFPTDVAAMHFDDAGRGRSWAEKYGDDPAAAERRAVVRAAASIGQAQGDGK